MFHDTNDLFGDLLGNPERGNAAPSCVQAEDLPLFRRRTVEMVSDDIIKAALALDSTSVRIMAKGLAPRAGDRVGARLNLNIYKSKGVAVQTIHAGNATEGYTRNRGFYNGNVIAYAKVVCLENVYLNVSQSFRDRIASGTESKGPMASVDGIYAPVPVPSFDGIEVRFDPMDVHWFCDLEYRPIRYAEYVTVYGNRVYCRGGIEYYTEDNAPAKVGDAVSKVRFP
ncbi:hypothetical protein [Noviherbaspirillum malthae]|uniref:hypothetical protein n=1 Tax=Noviherbaspirillum malthae TaxID=1260987 RepID=UPI00188FB34F|nr:hypothetical protein [Noviherbaspirillum malthae]